MNLNGKIIVIEGTDGSGKQTQVAKLKERLIQAGYEVYTASFPNYVSDSSAAVRMYLQGKIKESLDDISAKAASIFYAVDRYITYKTEIEEVYKEGKKVILFDRWVDSNIIHQGAKLMGNLPDGDKRIELKKFVTWLDTIEHVDMGVPRADMTIYLNVPIDYTITLRENRANKITGEEKQDIHEADIEYLKKASETGLIAAQLFNWEIVECVQGGRLRTIQDISDEIWQNLSKFN